MEKRVYSYVKANRIFEPGDKVVLGLSGGADSVCLLLMLNYLRHSMNIDIFAVHVNHMIRGEEAVRDRIFCENLCKEYNVELEVFEIDVTALAKEKKLTVEEAGRNARYEAFGHIAKKYGANKIAVAHHKNDQAETVLHNLFRGTGIRGLSGMRPANDNIVRPLLDVSREDIEEYLNKHNIQYVTDSTNESNEYMRNKLRNELLPYAKEHINRNVIDNINQAAKICAGADAYITGQALVLYKECVKENEKCYEIKADVFSEAEDILKSYMVREVLKNIYPSLKDLSLAHVEAVVDLVDMQVGKSVNLPQGVKAIRTYDGITIGEESENETCIEPIEYETEIFTKTNNTKIVKNDYTKYFDYDKIKGGLLLRTRQTGDYLVVDSKGSKKKLKDYFIDNKIPRQLRDYVPLFADGNHIIWVVGYRISEAYKVDENTKNIIRISVKQKNER